MCAFTARIAGLAVLALAASAPASMALFTDTSQLDVGGTPAYALNIAGPDLTVRGVTFQAASNAGAPAGVTMAAPATFNWSANGYGTPVIAGTDAANMAEVLNTFAYNQTFIDLAVANGQSYNLQLVGAVQAIWPTHTFSVTIGQIGPDPFTQPVINAVVSDGGLSVDSGTNYLYTTQFTANASTMRIKVTADASVYVVASGLILTPVSVPEPASIGLLGLGAMGLLARRRK